MCDEETIARNRRILDGVVRGIAHYGNCFGVPTVGGEVQFEPGYSANPLVNVLALGIAKKEDLFFAKARGVGNPVIYVGAKTGRDGIHGASLLASAEFTEESQQKRPNVQVGDPFMEKLLLEACLEAMQTGAVVAIQDMGAAGLTSTSCEMASRGGLGIEIELARVPQREPGMTPYEMMLSESQERMLLVAERGREQEVLKVFAKWGLDAVEIGRVTEDGLVRVLHHAQSRGGNSRARAGRRRAGLPASARARPRLLRNERLVEFGAAGADLTENFRALLAAPAIASKRWIWEQYDYMVRTNTLEAPGAGDAAVVRIKGTKRALALAADGNGRWCRLDPFVGAQLAVAEAARNVACSGAKPMAATNCLNFGSPGKTGSDVAVQPRHRRHRRGVHRARNSHHRRQREFLQRNARPLDRSDAGARRAGNDRRCFARAGDGVSRGRRCDFAARWRYKAGGCSWRRERCSLPA